MKSGALLPALAGALVALVAACERPPAPEPILEEPTASALRGVSARALERVRAAMESVEAAGSEAAALEDLREAEATLRKLTEYYVPLIDAREHAYRACRFYYRDPSRVETELERVEALLQDVARTRGPEVESAMEQALGLVESARGSLDAGSDAAPEKLEELARRLSFLVLKAELVLADGPRFGQGGVAS